MHLQDSCNYCTLLEPPVPCTCNAMRHANSVSAVLNRKETSTPLRRMHLWLGTMRLWCLAPTLFLF